MRNRHFPPVIRFSYPRRTMAVSLTGARCELNCAHCGGHYLKQMKSLADASGAGVKRSSFLISGGCTAEGKVPVAEHLAELQGLKQGRRFNIHVGLPDDAEMIEIGRLADCVSFDFVGDDSTIREVLGLDKKVEDYLRCYRQLRKRAPVMPHICIGLHGGEIRGEYRAMELIRQEGAEGLTLLIFRPTGGTRFGHCPPPPLAEVIRLLAHSRAMFPAVPVHLGCLRPGGRYRNEVDRWAVRAGLNTLVNPTPSAVSLARELGLTVVCGEECCSL